MDWRIILIYYCGMINTITFLLFGIDKYRARKNKWRIRESTLLGLSFLGGSIGAYLGMCFFHHKTKKNRFQIGVPLSFALHIVIVYFLFLK